jgi:hypothetical protein
MNKALRNSKTRYPEIVLWWGNPKAESEIRLHDKTLGEAYEIALQFGYTPPVWYKPWQYLTGGLGVMTIGSWGEVNITGPRPHN